MSETAVRETILSRLLDAPKSEMPLKPELMPFPEMAMGRDALVERFTQNVAEQTGVVYRVKDNSDLIETLMRVLKEESITELAASDDRILASLTPDSLSDVSLKRRTDFEDIFTFKEYLFNKADAGITGADFAVAESGTLIISHNTEKPRLVSLAPAIHIAVVKLENLLPVYEMAIEKIYENEKPSQVTFITGPSMTADIQATPFRGMHGPKKLIVFLVELP